MSRNFKNIFCFSNYLLREICIYAIMKAMALCWYERRYFMKKIIDILKELNPKNDYEKSDDFISDGLIDSMDMQDLFARFEEEYNIEFAGTDLTPQNFMNIASIKDLLERRGVNGDI